MGLTTWAGAETSEIEEQINAFRSVKKIHIEVEECYKQKDDKLEGISLPFEEVSTKFLKYAGVEVVKDNYDAILWIISEGKSLGWYFGGSSEEDWYWAAAKISGKISLEIPGEKAIRVIRRFAYEPGPAIAISSNEERSELQREGFIEAFEGSPAPLIAKMIGEIYGLEVLLSALRDEDAQVRRIAVQVLGEIKDTRAAEPLIEILLKDDEDIGVLSNVVRALGELKDPRAVETLIAALQDEKWVVQISAADALKKITGQNFGEKENFEKTEQDFKEDAVKWQKWWEENKEKF